MEQLPLAAGALLAPHFVPSTPFRGALVGVLGQRGYLGLYSLVAFATIGWMSWAYGRAPFEPLWTGLRLAPAVAMPFAVILLASGLLAGNPATRGPDKLLKSPEPGPGL